MLVVVALLVGGCGGTSSSATSISKSAAAPTTTTPLTLNAGPAPWPDPDRVPERVNSAGLLGASSEYLIVHYHAHLDIFVNGHSEPVAASIGREDSSFFSPLHTHATSGMIHIEAPADRRFTLGMLFTEWGVRLTGDCVGGYCRPKMQVSAYVDGHRTSQHMPDIVLRKGEEIALVIGSAPSKIPSSWDCFAKIDPNQENPAQCADFARR
jgi:hypothetical protein